jgi:hypothetical protein
MPTTPDSRKRQRPTAAYELVVTPVYKRSRKAPPRPLRLDLPTTLGRVNLLACWFRNCPNRCGSISGTHVRIQEACPKYCREARRMRNIETLSKSMIEIRTAREPLKITALHRELVRLEYDTKDKSPSVVKIGPRPSETNKDAWMTFRLEIVEKFAWLAASAPNPRYNFIRRNRSDALVQSMTPPSDESSESSYEQILQSLTQEEPSSPVKRKLVFEDSSADESEKSPQRTKQQRVEGTAIVVRRNESNLPKQITPDQAKDRQRLFVNDQNALDCDTIVGSAVTPRTSAKRCSGSQNRDGLQREARRSQASHEKEQAVICFSPDEYHDNCLEEEDSTQASQGKTVSRTTNLYASLSLSSSSPVTGNSGMPLAIFGSTEEYIPSQQASPSADIVASNVADGAAREQSSSDSILSQLVTSATKSPPQRVVRKRLNFDRSFLRQEQQSFSSSTDDLVLPECPATFDEQSMHDNMTQAPQLRRILACDLDLDDWMRISREAPIGSLRRAMANVVVENSRSSTVPRLPALLSDRCILEL